MLRITHSEGAKAHSLRKKLLHYPASFVVCVGVVATLTFSCGGKKPKMEEERPSRNVTVPAFNNDSAYFFTEKQIRFGPRIPNTSAHKQAGDYFVSKLKRYGATVIEQEFDATTFDGKKLFL